MSLPFELRTNPNPRSANERQAILADPGFGIHFTDHMAVATWTSADGWHDSAIVPYGPFSLDPATAVLHYAQEIFEGLKAYRHADGSVWLFRPDQNAARMARSARRLALPVLPPADFLASIDALVAPTPAGCPVHAEQSLYLRPFMFASEAFLGVRAAKRVTYCCIASPAGPYFASGVQPVEHLDLHHLQPGGARRHRRREVRRQLRRQPGRPAGGGRERVRPGDVRRRGRAPMAGGAGRMNVYLVTTDNELITPELTGTILEGVTRDSILTLAGEFGLTPVERRIAIAELVEGIGSGQVDGAVRLRHGRGDHPDRVLADDAGRPHRRVRGDGGDTAALRKNLLDVQYGRAEDTHGWLRRVL